MISFNKKKEETNPVLKQQEFKKKFMKFIKFILLRLPKFGW